MFPIFKNILKVYVPFNNKILSSSNWYLSILSLYFNWKYSSSLPSSYNLDVKFWFVNKIFSLKGINLISKGCPERIHFVSIFELKNESFSENTIW